MNGRRVARGVRIGVPAIMAVAAVPVLMLGETPWVGYGLAIGTLLVSWAANRPVALGTDVAVRVLLVATAVGYAVATTTGRTTGAGGGPGWLMAGGVLLLVVLLAEPAVRRLARPWYHAANLPGARPGRAAAMVVDGTAWLANSAAVALLSLAAVLGVAAWSVLVPSAAVAGLTGWLAADGWVRWRTGHRSELAGLTREIRRHGPRFLVYFSAPPGSTYQVRMWLPYLERLGEPYLVVLTERHNLAPVAAATDAPAVVCETFEALDAVMVPDLRAAFYVNNGMKNAHCVRYTRLTHVQLYHGDSDKAVTASPLNAMFDRVFVAGQAAVDRFAAHGVDLPRDKIRIVGRPQVAELEVASGPVHDIRDKVVLYAPTWPGAHADYGHCSLPIAEAVVRALLARGATVILRAHPYAERDRRCLAHLQRTAQLLAEDRARTGRTHRWGRAASVDLTLFGCMNLSHAMICDVSSVATDYLFTGKPMAITDMTGDGDAVTTVFPVSRAAYVIDRAASNLPAVLDDLLEKDPLRPVRADMRAYYLGDAPPERYAEAFLTEARRCLTGEAASTGEDAGAAPMPAGGGGA